MAEKHETIADIIAEMRALSNPISDGIIAINGRSIADRLEAAWKREKATAKKSLVVGNAAKLREALAIAKKAICNHARANHTCDSLAWESSTINANCGDILCGHRDLCEAKTAIQKALAAPARNCDVGTAEEQTRRMEAEYCHVQKSCYESPSGRECPLHKAEVDCRLIWAQMPYREGGAK